MFKSKCSLFKIPIFLIMLLFLSMPTLSRAGVVATMGNQNSSGKYTVEVSTDGSKETVTFASDAAILFPYQSGTTNDTLTAADSGRTYVVTSGGTSPAILQLPAAAVGMVFPIVSATTYAVYINPNGTDRINYASLSAGHAIYNSSAAKGDKITFYCVTANEWTVSVDVGTWATAGGIGD